MGPLRILLFLATATQLLIALASAKPIVEPHHEAQFVDYLKKYGYLQQRDPRQGELNTDGDLREAVKKIQSVLGLPTTGDLSDPETLAIMEKKRCSMPDVGPSDNARRKRRWATHGTKWEKKELTYKIVNYSPDLKKEEIDQTIDTAIAMWQNASTRTFTKISTDSDKEADIMIKFVRGYHGDSRPADGPGRELAHAFFPLDNKGLAGDVHFDEDEKFTLLDPTNSGVDLLWLAVHELGHSLGLDHSWAPESIMFPFYLGYIENLKLDVDDKSGLQSIYGMPDIERVTPTPHTDATVPGLPDKCSVKMDAIVTTQDKTTWLFSGDYVWEINDYGAGEAQKIKEVFPELEENIDAAYTSKKPGHTIFFKGSRFWVYENRKHIYGPASITKDFGLPEDLENMDAVFEWGRNGKTYFFKDSKYWRYNPISKSIDSGYPRDISVWRGVPESKLDGAFQWKNGKTYFFKGQDYYAFDDRKVRVETGYPRDVAKYWMGCGSDGLVKLARVNNSAHNSAPSFVLFVVTLVLAWLF